MNTDRTSNRSYLNEELIPITKYAQRNSILRRKRTHVHSGMRCLATSFFIFDFNPFANLHGSYELNRINRKVLFSQFPLITAWRFQDQKIQKSSWVIASSKKCCLYSLLSCITVTRREQHHISIKMQKTVFIRYASEFRQLTTSL